jgi:NAD+ diphosphatase
MAFVPSVVVRDAAARKAWIAVHPRGLVGRGETLLLGDDDVDALGADRAGAHAVGALDGVEVLAIPFDAKEVPAPYVIQNLRMLAVMLDGEMIAVAGRAMHVVDWATTSRFCGRCGTKTEPVPGERCMKCPACRLTAYPRIAPAVIVLVRKGDQALLASNARFPGLFYSTLAGFSEIGESLEETLVREVREEVGIAVKNPRYFGSQPWPFPHSLMIGFTAEWDSGEIVVDPSEIADAKWFSADALPTIPPPLSIARHLIDAWVAEVK